MRISGSTNPLTPPHSEFGFLSSEVTRYYYGDGRSGPLSRFGVVVVVVFVVVVITVEEDLVVRRSYKSTWDTINQRPPFSSVVWLSHHSEDL